jgi:hypothetical protein
MVDQDSKPYQQRFEEVAQRILLQSGPYAGDFRACPDQYVGLVKSFVPGADFPERVCALVRKPVPCFLMVLESPHWAEFRRKREGRWIDDDLGPAYGATGKSITRHLSKVLDLEKFPEYGLVLINAVQYQCSRATRPLDVKLRDACFTRIWSQGGREDFLRRLSAIRLPGDIVVNACTKGDSKVESDELRELVQSAIVSAQRKGQKRTFRSSHPASWRSADRLKQAWS